jgi:hypothetical protein
MFCEPLYSEGEKSNCRSKTTKAGDGELMRVGAEKRHFRVTERGF